MNQIQLHKNIDIFLQQSVAVAKKDDALDLISQNDDARQYFYSHADERWLAWLRTNGLLDILKAEMGKGTGYSPELSYLASMVGRLPKDVVDVILETSLTGKDFNPSIVGRFLWICSELSGEHLARVVPKIQEEKWIPSMNQFNQWGFEFEKMFDSLAKAKGFEKIILLADAVLSVKPKDKKEGAYRDKPFYFNDLSYTKVFSSLVGIDMDYKEKALALAVQKLSEVITTREKDSAREFDFEDNYYLYDVDFFTLELFEDDRISDRDDVKALAATVKILAQELVPKTVVEAQRIYQDYFVPLPDTRSMWRLRLFVMSLNPDAFKAELKTAFFRLFTSVNYTELTSGAEYNKALHIGFNVLSEGDKRDFVNQVFEYFEKKFAEDVEDQMWHKEYGWRIISSLSTDEITENEKEKCLLVFGKAYDPNFEPEPSIGTSRGGSIRAKGPMSLEEFGKLSIEKIATSLRAEWAPGELRAQNTNDDFLNPLNAEGAGGLLRGDIPKRLQEYLNASGSFFERNTLDAHYTYEFLRGIQETLHAERANFNDLNIKGLLDLGLSIIDSAKHTAFDKIRRERDMFEGWLSGWNGVHSALADVIRELIIEDNGKILVDFQKYRNDIFSIIKYLLTYSDPSPEDENDRQSDPYSTAINSVRGRAFETFTLFVYQDGKQFTKTDTVKLSADVKIAYQECLQQENTRALMFMFGHYVPTFYFRDRVWLKSLLPQIFPEDGSKKELYLAAWEGYLSYSLYEEIFFDPAMQKLYQRGIDLDLSGFAKRQYFKEPNEGLAIHLALAFVHYHDFTVNSGLFQSFWKKDGGKTQEEFISFMGRHCITRESSEVWMNANNVDKEKIKAFWDWALKRLSDTKTLAEFGFWIAAENHVFDLRWLAEHIQETLRKTNGYLEWEYGLTKSIIELAQAAPLETLEILRLFLLEAGVKEKKLRVPYSVDREWKEAFEILYKNQETKDGAYKLIDDLIREGGQTFWGLEEIVKGK